MQTQAGVEQLRRIRMRWMGHRLHAEVTIAVDPTLTTAASHHIAEHVRHALFHGVDYLSEVVVHVDPYDDGREAFHEHTVHHELVPEPIV